MENLWEKKSVGYGEEMERKWNGNGMEYFMTNQVEKNFDGIVWKGTGRGVKSVEKNWCVIFRKLKGNGMEEKRTNLMEEIFD